MTHYRWFWIPIAKWLDADGVRHTDPAHPFGLAIPYRRSRRNSR